MNCAGPGEVSRDSAGAGTRGEGEGRPHQVPQRWQRGYPGKAKPFSNSM
jgi:hypothetical protein